VRLLLCFLALEPEVRDNFSELLMSMVKERIGKREFSKFIAMVDTIVPAIGSVSPDMQALLEGHLKSGSFAEMEAEIEAIEKGSWLNGLHSC